VSTSLYPQLTSYNDNCSGKQSLILCTLRKVTSMQNMKTHGGLEVRRNALLVSTTRGSELPAGLPKAASGPGGNIF
jgi:hypothetical protein